MPRLTAKTEGSCFTADIEKALARLGAYEDLHEALEQEQASITAQLAELRAAGKQKTVKYRELFGKKLQNMYVLSLLQSCCQ